MRLGVVVAFEAEIGRIDEQGEIKTVCGVRYAEVPLGENTAVIALSGIGKVNAGACVQVLISVLKCEAILNIGLAGNACDLPLGGAVLADRVVYHDLFPEDFISQDAPGTSEFIPDEKMCMTAEKILADMNVEYRSGTVASGDQFISDKALKDSIIRKTGCSCVEMEGAAIAHISLKNNVPFCLVKIISDNADDDAGEQFDETVLISSYLETSVPFIRRFAESFSF
ncbi:MAG: 5'-methylthioadenosine/S-adenosylhomocysteine nucleosidase [Oscillospiraceae bacterium]|nr:5'-methylthioadenosine/S-adenosylhomocysteine nucleosidase [Oscillospiraceae bacterium]